MLKMPEGNEIKNAAMMSRKSIFAVAPINWNVGLTSGITEITSPRS